MDLCSGTKLYTPEPLKYKEKKENILVFARVRPTNGYEKSKNALLVVDCPGSREVVIRERMNTNSVCKTFTFDRVFGPQAKQMDVYKAVVAPLLEEVLLGYNCTVFAYGQTGTGKTFTMEGERSVASGDGLGTHTWESDPLAGIVPRAMSQLFDELRVTNSEFTVRVSLLEMYNEEVYDLLSPTEDTKPKIVRLYEDSSRKGSVLIQGLEEVIVHNKHEVYAIMERGSQMRKTASTLLNATSSRSHTVFTVTVHIKESNLIGEDLLKIGKLHLVDLAGSENIGRSGAVDKRAREAGNINQSLLTLGRVITALVEKAPHVPYRESKLTRLLQDSLGGKTKTSIIATISPASINLEETLSTLDYAYRAKNIQNRPEVNQKLTKKAMLKEYTEEIERLRRDLIASREKNGVFIDAENYEHMISQIDFQGQDLADKIQYTKSLEEQIQQKEAEYAGIQASLNVSNEDLNTAKAVMEILRAENSNLKDLLAESEVRKDEMSHLVKIHSQTEEKLSKEARSLLHTATDSTLNLDTLYNRLERKRNVETSNREAGKRFQDGFDCKLKKLASDVEHFSTENSKFSGTQRLQLADFLVQKELKVKELNARSLTFMKNIKCMYNKISEFGDEQLSSTKQIVEEMKGGISKLNDGSNDSLQKFLKGTFLPQISALLAYVHDSHLEFDSLIEGLKYHVEKETNLANDFVNTQLDGVTDQIRTVKSINNMNEFYGSSFKEGYKNFQSISTSSLTSVIATQREAMEEMRRAMNLTQNLLLHLSTEEEFVTEHHELQSQFLRDSSDRLLKKLDDNYMETTKFPLELKKEHEQMLSKVDETKNSIHKLQENKKAVIKAMESNMYTVMTYEKEQWQEAHTKTTERLNRVEKHLSQHACRFGKLSNELINSHDQHFVATDQSLFDALKRDQQHVATLRLDLYNNCTGVSLATEDFRRRLHLQSEELNEFWNSTYIVDLPTGATPQRKAYDFPRNLSATSPHERVLERFRDFKINITPLHSECINEESSMAGRDVDENTSPTMNEIAAAPVGSRTSSLKGTVKSKMLRSASDLSKGQNNIKSSKKAPPGTTMVETGNQGTSKKAPSASIAEPVNQRTGKKLPPKAIKKVLSTPN